MYIPKDGFIYVNIVVIIIFLIYVFKSYKNGFVYELVNLAFLFVSILLSWLISPILANKATLYNVNADTNLALNTESLNSFVNTLIWFVLIIVVLNVLFMLIKPLLKFFSKLPVLGTVNKFLGGIVGVLYGLFVTIIISMLLTLPIFKNGKEVVNGTILKYANNLNSVITKVIVQNVDLSSISIGQDFDVDNARKDLEHWLVEQGIINE